MRRADVFYTENSPPLEALAERGLLARVNASTLAKTPGEVQLARQGSGRRSRPA